MKLYSWNMYFRNDPDRVFRFIETLEFDVLCLQEVPEKFLERLKTLPRNITYGIDIDRVERGIRYRNYCVILTPHRILATKQLSFPVAVRPLRTKLFQFMMWRLRRIDERGSVLADIELPGGRARVFCLHLTLSYPEQLFREFGIAMAARDPSLPTIACGDFNVLESPHITLLNWLLGGRVRDIFAWQNGRKQMEKQFAELKLQNPLRGNVTQTISRSQLDHILVPENFHITHAEVMPDRAGSDHHPILVDCSLEQNVA